jgi:molecular chaperone GrpE
VTSGTLRRVGRETVGKKEEAKKPAGNGAGEPGGDLENSPECPGTADLELRIRELEEEVARWESEAKVNYDRFTRERAELENFKRRTTREKEEAVRYGNEALVRDLLPVLDNLERALEHANTGGNGQPLLDGVNLVLGGLLEVLGRHGVACVAALGERFDPSRHEAMEQIESDEHEPSTVVREHQKGYSLNDRLIRPALVGVSTSATGGGETESGEGDPE